MGLAPILVREIFKIIQELKASGMTVLLIEQNARLALSIADRAYVLETGRIVMEGNAQELLENDQVHAKHTTWGRRRGTPAGMLQPFRGCGVH